MNLKNLSSQYIELQNLEVDNEAILNTLDGINAEIQIKAANIIAVILNIESDISQIDVEISRLSALKKARQSRISSIKSYLISNMEACNIKRIECPLFMISHVDGKDVAEIFDDQAIPDSYVRIKTTISPDKKSILDDLKEGVDIPGARIKKGNSSIRIK